MSNFNSTFDQLVDQPMSVSDVSGIQSRSLINEESPPNFVTQRNKFESELRSDFKIFQETILSTLEGWFAKQDVRYGKLLTESEEIKKSLTFMCGKYEDLNNKTKDLHRRIEVLEKRSVASDEQRNRIEELDNKIEMMEQQARQCNLEINNLPEKRGEDLTSILVEMAKLAKLSVTRQDVIAIHRVPHANPNDKRPKNVVVKLSSKIIRDNILSSIRMAKGITSAQLNISGNSLNVYVNEHLTLKNKKLFRETRNTAKENGYKYTWIKNGFVLVRENESSALFAIRRQEDLRKLKKKPN